MNLHEPRPSSLKRCPMFFQFEKGLKSDLSGGFLTTLCSSGLPGLISPAFGYATAYFLAAMDAQQNETKADKTRVKRFHVFHLLQDNPRRSLWYSNWRGKLDKTREYHVDSDR